MNKKAKKWMKKGGIFMVVAAVWTVCYFIGYLGGLLIQKKLCD